MKLTFVRLSPREQILPFNPIALRKAKTHGVLAILSAVGLMIDRFLKGKQT